MTFHESRSVCYGFSQISERLPGLILKRGAKSQMLRASEIFWERLWNVWYQKNAQKISNIQTLPFPKPAHLQWAQDQGAATAGFILGVAASTRWIHDGKMERYIFLAPVFIVSYLPFLRKFFVQSDVGRKSMQINTEKQRRVG